MRTKIMLALLMLATVILPVTAQVVANEVEIRGDVSQFNSSASTFDIRKWDATNFAGFWYDIDDNKTTETLEVVKFKDSRSIDKDNLKYTTTRAAQKYKVFKEKGGNFTVEHGLSAQLGKPTSPARGGYYALVGWMAEKYIGVNGKNNKLARLIIEQDTTDKRTLQVGETWDVGDGYTLTAQSIDAKATPRQAWLVLSKDGTKLDDKVVSQNEIYTYSMKNLAAETDVPIFVTYVDSVFAGQSSDMVQLKYTWAISTKIVEVKSGDKFGIFEVDTESPLTLSNDASLSLSRDSTVSLAGNMKFKIADSEDDDVRFYPYVEIKTPGKYEVRGAVSEIFGTGNQAVGNQAVDYSVKEWDARNFAGFWYDIDDNQDTENLRIVKFKDSRTVDKDNLIYATNRSAQKYKVFKEKGGNFTIEHGLNAQLGKPTSPARGGYYALVGWMAEKYIGVNGKNNKLAKLVIEQDTTDKHTLQVGETWDVGDGYTLSAQSIDAKATPRQAWLVLSKDGTKLDDKVVSQNEIYTYSMKNMAGESDVPIFVTYVDSVFAGQSSDMVQLKFTWAISTKVNEVKTGDSFGIFEVDTEQPLTLTNDASLSLSRDSTINLAGNMKFKIADSEDNDVRFYPKIDYEIGNQTTVVTPTNQTTTTAIATPGNQTTAIATPGNQTTATVVPTETISDGTKPITSPTEKKGTPGFEAIIAIAGLLSVVYMVLRQKR